APTGTSPAASARRAAVRASNIQSSSLSGVVSEGAWVVGWCTSSILSCRRAGLRTGQVLRVENKGPADAALRALENSGARAQQTAPATSLRTIAEVKCCSYNFSLQIGRSQTKKVSDVGCRKIT